MKKILFVCHGNICRSPMAQMLLSQMVSERGLSAEYFIDSCATSTEELGNGIYPPARRKLIEKGVPLTMAVMSDSEVFDNSTKQATVLDAVENHGCKIAQHGGVRWTTYTEKGLNSFFETEKAFFANLGISVDSAVIPEHYASTIVKVVAGGMYGVVRSGFNGYDENGQTGSVKDFYDYYTSGENSNLYCLSSFNFSTSLSGNKDAIDYAKANNKVVIAYWHENDLTNETKANIEDAIDYALAQGLEFVTLDQLAHMIDLQRENT